MKALMWDNATLYASKGYSVLKYNVTSPENGWIFVGRYMPTITQILCEKSELLSRVKRAGFHNLTLLSDNSLIGIIDKHIVKLNPNSYKFETVFKITRGTRPLSLATNPQGHVFWGEYFSNANKESVNIYCSYDSGDSWSPIHTFPQMSIRHIHNIIWDKHIESFWIFTGDEQHECNIIRADSNMKNFHYIFKGSQQIRCVAGIPRPEGLYIASDTPYEKNNIYLIDRNDKLNTVSELPSSSLSSCEVSDLLFFSSAVEPSNINKTKNASLMYSIDGNTWNCLVKWKKSILPSKLFQFANITFPTGYNASNYVAATGISVRNEHMSTHLWKIETKV
tara:strand:+ start:7952 stop:8959 length:1008 start_codon:yes stop_codon:yes gene_type:complete